MKIAVIGSRTFKDYERLTAVLAGIPEISLVVSGGAQGADALVEQWARENHIPTLIHAPDWARFGRGTGIERNRRIISDCDRCIAFWDGQSKGTRSSIDWCRKLNKPVDVHRYGDGTSVT